MREEEAPQVVELCAVDEGLDLGGLEVRRREGLSGTKGGAERAVVARDHDGAGARRLVGDDLVRAVETLLLVCRPELVRQVVRPDRTEVRRRARRENVLFARQPSSAKWRGRTCAARAAFWAAPPATYVTLWFFWRSS